MLLGAHESTAGGLHEAIARGLEDRAQAVQIFTKSSRMWRAREISGAEAALFREAERASGLGTTTVHASYLINLGCDAGDLREKSIGALRDELERCEQIGAPYLVLHPGSHADRRRGMANVADGISRAFRGYRGRTQLLLETMAGQGSTLGTTFEELREMRLACDVPDRVAFCFDTCHVFAAGYDLSTPKGYERTLRQFDDVLGFERLKVFHLNDSKKPLGCRVDRHEHVCKGCIGEGAFRSLVNESAFRDVPGYLEIPPEGNAVCLRRLRGLLAPAKRARPNASRARHRGRGALARPRAAD